jgi:hypothetical protein
MEYWCRHAILKGKKEPVSALGFLSFVKSEKIVEWIYIIALKSL